MKKEYCKRALAMLLSVMLAFALSPGEPGPVFAGESGSSFWSEDPSALHEAAENYLAGLAHPEDSGTAAENSADSGTDRENSVDKEADSEYPEETVSEASDVPVLSSGGLTLTPDPNLSVTRKLTAGLKSAGGGMNLLRGYNYPVGGNIFRSLSISASYNGSNIVISFSYDIFSPYDIWHIYMGYGGELCGINVYSSGTSNWDSLTTCSFGTVSYSSVSHTANTAKASGTITVTNPSGLKSWYEGGNHAFWFDTYDPGSGPTVSISCSDQSPMNVSGLGTAIAYATCAHSYVCAAVDASTHRTACTKCGFVLGTGAHDANVSDTSSSPGYTIRKCSACGYIRSTTANSYTVTFVRGDGASGGTESISAVYAAAMPAITVPQRTGHSFKGYFTEADGAGTQYYTAEGTGTRAYDIAGPVTLYAYWDRNCTVTVSGVKQNEFGFKGT